jgi:hypothetical protein
VGALFAADHSAAAAPLKTQVSRHPIPAVLAFLIVVTAFLTWPQVAHLGTHVAAHDDPLLSLWRLSWVAHALSSNVPLFDGNIFYPHRGTLAYSDATLLQGVLAAPWLWSHVNPVLVYNVLLLAGIVTSGLGMFVLVRDLMGNDDAALVSAVIFTLAPYRVEHFMHLELQWTMWMPLTFWAVHRVFKTGSIRFGVLAGLFLWLQIISCVYYGIFLMIMVGVLVALSAASDVTRAVSAIRALAIGAILPGILTVIYAQPYLTNARVLGPRDPGEVATFSAHLTSYLSAPWQNWWWGWTGYTVNGDELHLFPGLLAVALALPAFVHPLRRVVGIYLAMLFVAVLLSLGVHAPPYYWLYQRLRLLQGLRAPARFGILADGALAVLAGFGFEVLQRRVPPGRLRRAVFIVALAAIGLESGAYPMTLIEVPPPSADVYKFLKSVYPSVVVEFPITEWNLAPLVMYWSSQHWNPIVNGYSGYQPPSYEATLKHLRTFPDNRAIARLQELGVRYILIHEYFYKAADRADLLLELAHRPELIPNGRYRGPIGNVQVFELRR